MFIPLNFTKIFKKFAQHKIKKKIVFINRTPMNYVIKHSHVKYTTCWSQELVPLPIPNVFYSRISTLLGLSFLILERLLIETLQVWHDIDPNLIGYNVVTP